MTADSLRELVLAAHLTAVGPGCLFWRALLHRRSFIA